MRTSSFSAPMGAPPWSRAGAARQRDRESGAHRARVARGGSLSRRTAGRRRAWRWLGIGASEVADQAVGTPVGEVSKGREEVLVPASPRPVRGRLSATRATRHWGFPRTQQKPCRVAGPQARPWPAGRPQRRRACGQRCKARRICVLERRCGGFFATGVSGTQVALAHGTMTTRWPADTSTTLSA